LLRQTRAGGGRLAVGVVMRNPRTPAPDHTAAVDSVRRTPAGARREALAFGTDACVDRTTCDAELVLCVAAVLRRLARWGLTTARWARETSCPTPRAPRSSSATAASRVSARASARCTGNPVYVALDSALSR
jgi:hypothetical protein